MKRSYITAGRLAAIESRLSERDRQIVHDVGHLRLMSGRQLSLLHYGVTDSARRLCRLHLNRLVTEQLLIRLDRRIGGVRAGSEGYVYGLGVAGRRLLFPDRRRWWATPNPHQPFMLHTLSVADAFVTLHLAARRGGFTLTQFDAEPFCWRSFVGAGGARLVLKPDAFVVTEAGGFEDHVMLEVDLATESGPRITAKARVYAQYFQTGQEQERHGLFPGVVWLVPDEPRRALVARSLARLDADYWRLFSVHLASETVSAIAGSATDSGFGRQL